MFDIVFNSESKTEKKTKNKNNGARIILYMENAMNILGNLGRADLLVLFFYIYY